MKCAGFINPFMLFLKLGGSDFKPSRDGAIYIPTSHP